MKTLEFVFDASRIRKQIEKMSADSFERLLECLKCKDPRLLSNVFIIDDAITSDESGIEKITIITRLCDEKIDPAGKASNS